eukprot:jgi/Chrzof1/6063/Cz17g07110.t1
MEPSDNSLGSYILRCSFHKGQPSRIRDLLHHQALALALNALKTLDLGSRSDAFATSSTCGMRHTMVRVMKWSQLECLGVLAVTLCFINHGSTVHHAACRGLVTALGAATKQNMTVLCCIG